VKPPKMSRISVRVPVAAVVKAARSESIAAGAPQQRKALPTGLREWRRTVRDDQGSETSAPRLQRPNLSPEFFHRGGCRGRRPRLQRRNLCSEPFNRRADPRRVRLLPRVRLAAAHSRQETPDLRLQLRDVLVPLRRPLLQHRDPCSRL
jgi:hypothetical protein